VWGDIQQQPEQKQKIKNMVIYHPQNKHETTKQEFKNERHLKNNLESFFRSAKDVHPNPGQVMSKMKFKKNGESLSDIEQNEDPKEKKERRRRIQDHYYTYIRKANEVMQKPDQNKWIFYRTYEAIAHPSGCIRAWIFAFLSKNSWAESSYDIYPQDDISIKIPSWIARYLLLMSGDIHPNPGPSIKKIKCRHIIDSI